MATNEGPNDGKDASNINSERRVRSWVPAGAWDRVYMRSGDRHDHRLGDVTLGALSWQEGKTMSLAILGLAKKIKDLKYDEMIEVAGWFSDWTAIDGKGNDQIPTIDRETMAANLSDWAQMQIDGHP